MTLQERFDPFVAEWATFARNAGFNLAEKCLKLAQNTEYPELNVDRYIQKINHIGRSLRETADGISGRDSLVRELNRHLFENVGFFGDRQYQPRGNFLNEVLDKKSGLPPTMSVLYVEIAKFIGLDIRLVGFAKDILVRCDGILLDPFNDGRRVDLERMQNESENGTVPGIVELDHWQILVILARNLKKYYTQLYDYERALRCADMALAVGSNLPEDIRDKGILEWHMLNTDSALRCLHSYLDMNPNADDASFILELIKNIKN